MIYLRLIAALLTLSAMPFLHARPLDSARELARKIEVATGGKIQILNPEAEDELFDGAEAEANLNHVLRTVLDRSDLATLSPTQIGQALELSLGEVTQHSQRERASGQKLEINRAKSEERFCRLASEPCRLFSSQLRNLMCAGD